MRSSTVARNIARLALSKKAENVILMDLRGLTSMADFFVVCSADSDVQMKAIADAVEEGMEAKGSGVWHRESGSAHWILLDYVDIVLHIFHKNTRGFYNLEKLWGDAKITPVADSRTRSQGRSARPARGRRTQSRRKSVAS